MSSRRSGARRVVERLAWAAVIGSFPVWFAAFLVAPFLPFDAATRTAIAGVCLALGEVMFWVGGIVLGPAVIARFRPPRVRTGKSFVGKRIAVFGATGGLGEAVARAARREGAHVVVLGRDLARLEPLATELDAPAIAAELTQPLAGVVEALGTVDHIVVAAGVDLRMPLESHTDLRFAHVVDVDLLAPMRLVRDALTTAIAPGGSILVVGGFLDGRLALPYYAADVAARAGLAAFCESVNHERALAGDDRRVTYACPAPADTAAERPYAALWRSMGSTVAAPEQVADFLVAALVRRPPLAIMGASARLLRWVNAAVPSLGRVVIGRFFGPRLRTAFGTMPAEQAAPGE
jgi:short-subunit dehydrogenase